MPGPCSFPCILEVVIGYIFVIQRIRSTSYRYMKHLIVIETPKGSREKYYYDADLSHYKLKKLLPLGMVFPYDFGFIPGTKGEDGDPLDAMIISEFDSFPGCHIDCRLIGALRAEQIEKRKKLRNDRFFFVPVDSVLHSQVKSIREFSRA